MRPPRYGYIDAPLTLDYLSPQRARLILKMMIYRIPFQRSRAFSPSYAIKRDISMICANFTPISNARRLLLIKGALKGFDALRASMSPARQNAVLKRTTIRAHILRRIRRWRRLYFHYRRCRRSRVSRDGKYRWRDADTRISSIAIGTIDIGAGNGHRSKRHGQG